MIEVPISIISWVFVVGIQAIIHFFIFGVRRERIQQEEEVKYETLSLSTRSDSFTDHAVDADPVEAVAAMNNSIHMLDNQATAVAAASSSSLLYFADGDEDEEDDIILEDATAELNASSLTLDDSSTMVEPSPYYLMQTGKDILRRCSIENAVQEQIRAVPQ